jgi:hypothetical protein
MWKQAKRRDDLSASRGPDEPIPEGNTAALLLAWLVIARLILVRLIQLAQAGATCTPAPAGIGGPALRFLAVSSERL